ncbi:MAG: hypothetical protein NXI24_13080 [bacterium]|nr:hypothetical protein [bacterium]
MIQFYRALARQSAGMIQITAILLVPLLVCLIYIRLHVSMSSLNRQNNLAALRKEELVKRNRALKSALTGLALAAGENPFRWQAYEASPLRATENKIVRIRLPERFTGDAPDEILQPD